MIKTDSDKFVMGRITGFIVTYGATSLVRVFDDKATMAFCDDNYPTDKADALMTDWCVEKVFKWKGAGR